MFPFWVPLLLSYVGRILGPNESSLWSQPPARKRTIAAGQLIHGNSHTRSPGCPAEHPHLDPGAEVYQLNSAQAPQKTPRKKSTTSSRSTWISGKNNNLLTATRTSPCQSEDPDPLASKHILIHGKPLRDPFGLQNINRFRV